MERIDSDKAKHDSGGHAGTKKSASDGTWDSRAPLEKPGPQVPSATPPPLPVAPVGLEKGQGQGMFGGCLLDDRCFFVVV